MSGDAVVLQGVGAEAPAGTLVAPARPGTISTVGWLRLAAAVLCGGAIALGLVGASVAESRRRDADAIVADVTPVLVGTQDLYFSLADADAAATTAFLHAGLEPAGLQARYANDLDVAGDRLASIASESGLSDEAKDAVAAIAAALPRYAADVEAARVNNRAGNAVGARYLALASKTMRDEILPAATTIYVDTARRLDDRYRSATSTEDVAIVLVAGGALILILVVVQLFLARRTRRLLNVGLVIASAVVLAIGLLVALSFSAQERALARSQQRGSDQLLALSTTRLLALRALSGQNLNLVARGTEPAHVSDFDATIESIGSPDDPASVLGFATAWADDSTRRQIEKIAERVDDFVAVDHETIRPLAAAYHQDEVDSAVGLAAGAAQRLDQDLNAEITVARDELERNARDARASVRPLATQIAIMAALVAVLVLVAVRRRLQEYS